MAPELRRSIAARARAAQQQLNVREIDPVVIATEAKRIFDDAADETRSRWLALELNGYSEQLPARPLHEVLQVASGDRLAAHVAAYRSQRGLDPVTRAQFRHFFVESLGEIDKVRTRLAGPSGSPTLLLDFGARVSGPSYPRSGEFATDVFERVIAGFLAALHLQLRDLVG